MTSPGALLTSSGIPVGPPGNPFTVFPVGYRKIQLVLTENRSGAIETGWSCSGGNSSTKDTWSEIWGDGIDAAVKDGAAIVYTLTWLKLSFSEF